MEGLVVNAESKSRVVLRVQDLRVHYHTPRGPVRAVEGVGFELRAGERLGLVGESGSGKSTTAMALMQLIRPPGGLKRAGSISTNWSCWHCPRRRCGLCAFRAFP